MFACAKCKSIRTFVPRSLFAVLIWCTCLYIPLPFCKLFTLLCWSYIFFQVAYKKTLTNNSFLLHLVPSSYLCPKHSNSNPSISRVYCVPFLDTPGQGGNKQTMHFSCANIRFILPHVKKQVLYTVTSHETASQWYSVVLCKKIC